MNTIHPGQTLAQFAATLTLASIPAPVLRRTEDLLLDWLACALAGKGARPVETIARFAERMGPAEGPCEILVHRTRSSPLMAAVANAAASHFVEQDDVHNGSMFHPATVVFPPALAVAQALGRSGAELLVAAVAGYEVGIRVGEFLDRSHYKIFHTTGTAGTLAAAATVGRLLRLALYQGGASEAETRRVIGRMWSIAESPRVAVFLGYIGPGSPSPAHKEDAIIERASPWSNHGNLGSVRRETKGEAQGQDAAGKAGRAGRRGPIPHAARGRLGALQAPAECKAIRQAFSLTPVL